MDEVQYIHASDMCPMRIHTLCSIRIRLGHISLPSGKTEQELTQCQSLAPSDFGVLQPIGTYHK